MTVQAIKLALKKLPMSKRIEIMRWVTESVEQDAWDRQMDKDASAGKLNFLLKEGKEAARKGKLLPAPRA